MTTLVGRIIYSDEITELKPLTEMGVDFVLRYGDTKTAYYRLDYSKVKEYGYAFTGEQVPRSFFDSLDVEYVDSKYFKPERQEFW